MERGPPPRGAGEGRKEPWGRAEWNLARAAGGVKESTEVLGIGPPDSRRSPAHSMSHLNMINLINSCS